MTTAEFAGYVASLLVFMTFYMKTMVPLRLIGILSNLAFLTYALLAGLTPVMILHGALLPLNLIRLRQIMLLLRDIETSADGDLSIEVLLPFMTRQKFKANQVLFREGEPATEMYYVRRGIVLLPEIDRRISDGAILGEISMFSPDRRRTTTAVCETDGELLRLSEADLFRIYHQNPAFGINLIRLITRRLIQNYNVLQDEVRGRSGVVGPVSGEGAERAPREPADRTRPSVGARWAHQTRRRRAVATVAWAGAALLTVGYGSWAIAPYVRSVLFRDAALTTWINVATAPIRGSLVGPLPEPGDRVGKNGRIALVRNLQADHGALDVAEAEVGRAAQDLQDLEDHLAMLRDLETAWQARTAAYARTFVRNLDLAEAGYRRDLDLLAERLTLQRNSAERIQTLVQRGGSALATLDAELAEVKALEREHAEREMLLAQVDERRVAAGQGVFLLQDGRTPAWAYQSQDQLRLEIAAAEGAVNEAEARLTQARAEAVAARAAFELIAESPVVVPPDSVVWSSIAAAGAVVDVGAPVAEWIDCGVLLVDVPARDVEIGLLRPGMPADVLTEGERAVRTGRVLLTRGSASILSEMDLAATAKARQTGSGQVIVRLEPTREDMETCAIGTAAWVEFPAVSLIDLLRARLRL